MKQSDKGEEILQSGLIEEYVLGICEPHESERIEKLAAGDPKIASLITEMKKAMHCYCSSCHGEKIKSIQSKFNSSCTSSSPASGTPKLFTLPCAEKKSKLRNFLFKIKDFFNRIFQ